MLDPHPQSVLPKTHALLGLSWTGWLFIASIIAVLLSIIFQILTPKPKSVALPQTSASRQNMDGSASIFSNVVYQGPEVTVPKELPIVTADISESAANDIITYLIDYYQLSPHPELPNIWLNQDFLLSKNINNHEYLLTGRSDQLTGTYLSLPVAQQVVDQLLTSYPALSSLSLIDTKTKYYQMGGPHAEETTPPNANAISLEYSWKIEGIPLYLPKRFEGGFIAYISADRKPIRLSFPLVIPTIGNQVSSNKTLSLKEAVGQLNQSNGSIIYAEQTTAKPFDVSLIVSAQLKAVSLEYRIDPELKLAIPYYRFDGVIKNKTGSIYTTQLITPAVATTPVQ